jgi:hypothetical protein
VCFPLFTITHLLYSINHTFRKNNWISSITIVRQSQYHALQVTDLCSLYEHTVLLQHILLTQVTTYFCRTSYSEQSDDKQVLLKTGESLHMNMLMNCN